MAISAAISANQILKRVAVEVGLPPVPDQMGSTDEAYLQLAGLLQVACEDLTLAYEWEFLVLPFQIVTQPGDTNEYDLPDDFSYFVPTTEWNVTTDERIYPLTAQQWRAIEASDITPINWSYRIFGGTMKVLPDPPSPNNTLNFEYISPNFAVRDDANRTPIDTLTIGSDIVLFDRTLISRYLKALWLEAKGFDSSAAYNSFNQIFSFVTGKDDSADKLSAGTRGRNFRLISMGNAPEEGYGR
jgi:hypothetical protein